MTDGSKVNKFGGGYHSWEISTSDFENYLKVRSCPLQNWMYAGKLVLTNQLYLGPLRRHSCVRTECLVRQSHPPAGGHSRLQYQPGLCHIRLYLHRRDGRILRPGPIAQDKHLPSHTRLLGSIGGCALPESEGHLRGRHGHQRGDRSRCLVGAYSSHPGHQDVLHSEAQSLPATGRGWCGYRGKLYQNVSCNSITSFRRPDGRFCEVQPAWVQHPLHPFSVFFFSFFFLPTVSSLSNVLTLSTAQPKSP